MTLKRRESKMDKKRNLIAQAMKKGDVRLWWSQKDGYSAAQLLSRDPNSQRYRLRLEVDQREVEVDAEEVEMANPVQQDFSDDLSTLHYINEPAIVEVVRRRYGANLIHTYSGPSLLLTINPMRRLTIYSSKNREMFRSSHPDNLPPHIFSVAQKAYNALVDSGRSQTICLIGRSGSGKTHSHNHLVHYLVDVVPHAASRVTHDRVRAARTIVEAFTSSRTLTNTNASRCAQLTTLDFNYGGNITGLSVQLFLLERTRIVRRPEGEPTFHVFYHMLAGMDAQLRSELQIDLMDEPNLFMTPLQRPEDKERASKAWRHIMLAAELLEISEAEWNSICRLLAAIYHLGIAGAVSSGDGPPGVHTCQFEKPAPAQRAALLLGCPLSELRRFVFDPTLERKTGGDNKKVEEESNTTMSALELLEGFVTGLYTEISLMIAFFINRCMAAGPRSVSAISILDPPGFQNTASCGRNSGGTFEDFCYNYGQERLHQLNYELNFMHKRKKYEQENIDVSNFNVSTVSPSEVVNIMDHCSQGPPSNADRKDIGGKGLLWLVDEESLNGSEDTFVKRIYQLYHQHRHQIREKSRRVINRVGKNGNFILNHSLGTQPIQYNPVGWLKNCRDYPTTRNALVMLNTSKNSTLRTLMQQSRAESLPEHLDNKRIPPTGRTSGAFMYKQKSVSTQVKLQMDFLVDLLRRSGNVYFIYSLVPVANAGLCDLGVSPMAPTDGNLDLVLLRQQLRGFQVLQAIQTHKQGYPEELSFHDFRNQFESLLPSHLRANSPVTNEKEEVQKMLEEFGLDPSDFRIGLSQVFLRAGMISELNGRKHKSIEDNLILFQARCRGYLVRMKYAKLKAKNEAILCIQYNAKLYLERRHSPWMKLYRQVKPLLNIHRTDELSNEIQGELELLRKKCHKLEEENKQYLHELDVLQDQVEKYDEQAEQERTEAKKAKHLAHEAEQEKIRADARLNEALAKLNNYERKMEELEFDLSEAKAWQQRATNRDEDDDDDDDSIIEGEVYKARYERAARELEHLRRQMAIQREEADEEKDKTKKEMDRKVMEAMDENGRLHQELATARRKLAKLDSEVREVRSHLENTETRNAELERRQKRLELDAQRAQSVSRDESTMRDKLQRERDDIQLERNRLEKELQDVKSELGLSVDKAARLSAQVDDLNASAKSSASETEVLALKKAKIELQNKIRELEEEISDQSAEIQTLEKTNIRLDSNLESLRNSHAKELEDRELELDNLRTSTQKRLKAMEAQLEEEHDERQRLLREKREAERQLSEMLSREPQRDREMEKKLKKELKKTKLLLKDAQATLDDLQNQQVDKNIVNQLKDRLEEAEMQRESAQRAKKLLELEIDELQQQHDEQSRAKKESDDRCSALQREKSDLQLQIEDQEEELKEAAKKHRTVLSQQQAENAAMAAQVRELSDAADERDRLKRDNTELKQKIQVLESSQVDRSEIVRLEAKIRELEAALELETSSKGRLQASVDRLKEQIEILQEEKETLTGSEHTEKERARRMTRQLREAKDEAAEAEQRLEEADKRRSELANRLEQLQEDYATSQTDLKMAYRKIGDLQAIMNEDSHDSSDLDDDDRTNDLLNKADAVLRRHGSFNTPTSQRRLSTTSLGRRASTASLNSAGIHAASSDDEFVSLDNNNTK